MLDIAETLLEATQRVTNAYTKQVKREERSRSARYRRLAGYLPRTSKKSVLFDVLEDAYNKSSDNGRLPVAQRQVFYASRDLWLARDPSMNLQYNSFCEYLAEYTDARRLSWKILKDARGKLVEPHTNTIVPLGTAEVDRYLARSSGRQRRTLIEQITLDLDFPTNGPENRYSALLYIEKEGFNVILDAAGIPKHYDIAIASSKGQSVVAVRKLVDEFCGPNGVPLLIVHDFDQAGFSIAANLTRDSMRYKFANTINAIDLGLRLEDVHAYSLSSEPCALRGTNIPGDATEEEREFLLAGQRVELNAFTSPQFVEWIENKLKASGISKVVPDDTTLTNAYRRAALRTGLQRVIDDAIEKLSDDVRNLDVPSDLEQMTRAQLERSPRIPWDEAVADIASENAELDFG